MLREHKRRRNTSQFILRLELPTYQGQKKDSIRKNNYRPISLMNIHIKKPQHNSPNQNQQCIKIIIHHNEVGLVPVMQGCFNI